MLDTAERYDDKLMAEDGCIYCGKELSRWERTRSHCWMCNESMTVTYDEEEYTELEN